MTTEQEAQTGMICPSTRSVQHQQGLNCIGSPCMHWRWVRQRPEEQLHAPQSKDMRGYCGSAGSTQ